MNLYIRQERTEDYAEVYSIIKEAFSDMEHASGDEQDVVVRLRESDGFVPELSLVAEADGVLAGYILFTRIKIGASDSLMLAPIAVLPAYQRQGIGSALIREGHRIAKILGFSSVTLVGHPTYYPRFGYRRASRFKITMNIPVPDECFMAVELATGALRTVSGILTLPPAFGL